MSKLSKEDKRGSRLSSALLAAIPAVWVLQDIRGISTLSEFIGIVLITYAAMYVCARMIVRSITNEE